MELHVSLCAHCCLSCQWAPPSSLAPSSLVPLLQVSTSMDKIPWTSSLGWTVPAHSLSPHLSHPREARTRPSAPDGSPQWGAEGKEHLLLLGMFCPKQPRTPLVIFATRACCQQDPKVPLCKAAFQPAGCRPVLVYGIADIWEVLPQGLPFVEIQEVFVTLSCSLSRSTLNDARHSSQFHINCEVMEGASIPSPRSLLQR